jgi:hypothetical protein
MAIKKCADFDDTFFPLCAKRRPRSDLGNIPEQAWFAQANPLRLSCRNSLEFADDSREFFGQPIGAFLLEGF